MKDNCNDGDSVKRDVFTEIWDVNDEVLSGLLMSFIWSL